MKKTKILVTGLNGFIGSRFREMAKDKFTLIEFVHTRKKSITARKYVFDFLGKSKADVVLHLAAKTHIDRCQHDKKLGKFSQTWRINVEGAKNIADACSKYRKKLFYLSSECVFDGRKGNYQENDKPKPVNWYGQTKYRAEQEIIKSTSDYCILRSVLAYGHTLVYPVDLLRTFYDSLAGNRPVNAVADQYLSLTFIDDLADALMVLINKKAHGVYHFAGRETFSPYKFACEIADYFNFNKSLIKPVTLKKYFPQRHLIRLNSATLLSSKFINEFNFQPHTLKEALKKTSKRL